MSDTRREKLDSVQRRVNHATPATAREFLPAVRTLIAAGTAALLASGCWTPPRTVPALPAPLPAEGAATAASEFAAEAAPVSPVEAWRIDAGRGFVGAPRVRAPIAVAAHTGREVTVRATADGAVFWRRRVGSPITGLTVTGSVVYFAERSSRGTAHALDLTSTEELWTARVRHARLAPVAIGDVIVFTNDAGELQAFDARTGDEQWTTPMGATLAVEPVRIDEDLAVATIADTLYIVAADGTVPRRTPLPATASAAPLATTHGLALPLHDGTVVLVSGDGVASTFGVGDVVLARPVHDGADGIVVLNRAGELWRIAAGVSTRFAQLGSAATASLTRASNGFVVGLMNGAVMLIDHDGAVRWRVDTGQSIDAPAALDAGALYVATRRGDLIKLVEG